MNSIPPQKQMTGMLGHPVAALRPLGYRGICITVPWKVAVMPLLDELDDDVRSIGAANYITIRDGRLIGHNNDGKGVVKAIAKVTWSCPPAARRGWPRPGSSSADGGWRNGALDGRAWQRSKPCKFVT